MLPEGAPEAALPGNAFGGRLERFSLQQLVRFAARVDGEVIINVNWTSRRIWIIPPPNEQEPANVRGS